MNQAIEELECKVLALECEEVKKLAKSRRPKLRAKPATPAAPAKRTAAAGLTVHTVRRGDRTIHTVDGRELPQNRALWPAEVRTMVEGFEAYDKRCTVNGRRIGMCDMPVQMVY